MSQKSKSKNGNTGWHTGSIDHFREMQSGEAVRIMKDYGLM